MSSANDFLFQQIPAIGKRVHRLGLATNFGLDEAGIMTALELGLNYIWWPIGESRVRPLWRTQLKKDRDRLVVAACPSLSYFGWQVRRAAERALRDLDTDYLDLFQLGWVGRGAAWTEATVNELLKLREEGKVRAIGVSIHDRPRAGRLAEESPLDFLMIRYNAAHPGAERDIFPKLGSRPDGKAPFIVAYTATSWGKLLSRPSGWEGMVPTAGDCYRFCLSSPHINVVLCGPKNVEQLRENLSMVEKGALSTDEMTAMRAFGQRVHDGNRIPFSPS